MLHWNKFEIKLDWTNYANKEKLDYATGVGTSDVTGEGDFIPVKAEVDKLDINKLNNVPTCFNNLKTKLDNLDAGKLKTVSVDLKKLTDVVDNEVLENKNSTH